MKADSIAFHDAQSAQRVCHAQYLFPKISERYFRAHEYQGGLIREIVRRNPNKILDGYPRVPDSGGYTVIVMALPRPFHCWSPLADVDPLPAGFGSRDPNPAVFPHYIHLRHSTCIHTQDVFIAPQRFSKTWQLSPSTQYSHFHYSMSIPAAFSLNPAVARGCRVQLL